MGKLAKLNLGSSERFGEYIVRSQELMTRFSDSGEKFYDTILLIPPRLSRNIAHN